MTTDASSKGKRLTASERVQKFRTVLRTKAKEEPRRRFHALSDKVWREDFLTEAWRLVRRNGGVAGVDGESIADVEARGVKAWLGELSRELREGTYAPLAVRQVMIPKKQPGQFRPLGIPCLRDRVAQTSAMLLLSAIFEADLQPEQYAYREERSAWDAVNRIHALVNRGYAEVVDGDLSNYFGEIPHAELLKSLARRVSDGRLLGWVKAWLEMPVEEDDGKGGTRRTARARKERKGIPQGSPLSPLCSNIYMRRFILGWKMLGKARRFCAEIVNYADDFCVLGKAPAVVMLSEIRSMMTRLKLRVNEQKTRCLRSPEEPFVFLGYRIGRNYRPRGGSCYVGTRPAAASVQGICRKISRQTGRWNQEMTPEEMVKSLNRRLRGWANYYALGQVSPAYRIVDWHTTHRLRQWLCRKHRVKDGKYVRFPDRKLWHGYGLLRLAPTTKSLPWAKGA